jgi:hypothetical protein
VSTVWRSRVLKFVPALSEKPESKITRLTLDAGRTKKLQSLLPAKTALVDVINDTHFSPPPHKKGPPSRQRRLVAFIVGSDAAVKRVDLGPSRRWPLAVGHRNLDKKTSAVAGLRHYRGGIEGGSHRKDGGFILQPDPAWILLPWLARLLSLHCAFQDQAQPLP